MNDDDDLDGIFVSILKVLFSGHRLSWLKVESGDFPAFFVREMDLLGSHAKSEDPPQSLPAKWRFQSDSSSFRIQVSGVDFSQVTDFLQETYGRARFPDNARGEGKYNPADIGLFMSFIDEGKTVLLSATKGWPDK